MKLTHFAGAHCAGGRQASSRMRARVSYSLVELPLSAHARTRANKHAHTHAILCLAACRHSSAQELRLQTTVSLVDAQSVNEIR